MKKPAAVLFAALVLFFLGACVRAVLNKPVAVNPLPPPAIGAADEFALPPFK